MWVSPAEYEEGEGVWNPHLACPTKPKGLWLHPLGQPARRGWDQGVISTSPPGG